jgi:hypothetical protein
MEEKSIANKLQELFELYKSGALTEQEYNNLKSEIISIDINKVSVKKTEDIQNDSFQKKSQNLQDNLQHQNSSLKKENNSKNITSSQINTVADNSQKVNSFDVNINKPKKTSNQIILILGILCVIFAIAAIYIFFNKNEANKENPINPITTANNSVIKSEQTLVTENQINSSNQNDLVEKGNVETNSQDEIVALITQYYIDIDNNAFFAENYYSDNVNQFINRKNISPSDINSIFLKNKEFVNGTTSIVDNVINFDRNENEINYYNYWIDYKCFRKSKNSYQSCKVKVEIGFDDQNKIKSYKELEIVDLKFTPNEY